MGVITRGDFAKSLLPGVERWYGEGYNKYPTKYTDIYETRKSTRAYEESVATTTMGLAVQKTEGGSITYDDFGESFVNRHVHLTYGKGFTITREMIEDNQYSKLSMDKSRMLGWCMHQTLEVLGANPLARAFNSSYAYGDGKELCATDHPYKDGTTWSNEPSVASALSEAAIEQMVIDISRYATDGGLTFAAQAMRLIIPPDLQFTASRTLKSMLRTETANNDINAIRVEGILPEGYRVNPYLTNTTAWFAITNVPNGMVHHVRRAPAVDTDNDFDTENAKFKATMRVSFGCDDAHGIYGSPGTV